MHRIASRPVFKLRSSFSRHNSTEPRPSKRTVRVPVARLGDVLIPSLEEVRAKTAETSNPSYAADISYLENASNKFLSAKLARLGKGQSVEEKPSKEKPTKRQGPTSEEIAALTAKRRENRIARSAEHLRNYVPVSEKSQMLRSEFEKLDAFMSPERNGQSPPKPKRIFPRRPPQARGIINGQQDTGNPRWNERYGPRQQHGKAELGKRPEQNKGKRRAPIVRPTQSSTPSIHKQEIDESVFQPEGHLPEFNGPESPSLDLLDRFGPTFIAKDVTVVAQSGTTFKIPLSKVDSFYKGGYSRYVTASKEDYASLPDTLGALKVAERTLSRQRHYNLAARDRTLELVAQASQPMANYPAVVHKNVASKNT